MSSDAFDILGLEPRFDLDPSAIRRAYLARAGTAHPDRAGPPVDGNAVGPEASAAALNVARATLENPERRATALLARLGGPGKEADRSLPDGFLMQMMDIREQIAAAADKAPFIAWGEQQRAQHIRRAADLFTTAVASAHDSASVTPTLKAIRRELNAWRYIERLIEQIDGENESGETGGPHP